MPFPQHESELSTLVTQRIRERVLPAEVPKTIWAGEGSGEPCSLCHRTIGRTETEYELDAPVATANSVVRLHLRCHALWQRELARRSD